MPVTFSSTPKVVGSVRPHGSHTAKAGVSWYCIPL